MEITQMTPEFQQKVGVDPHSGCWIWQGGSTPNGTPTWKRRSAWKWAYLQATGRLDLPAGKYPTISSCEGPLFCVLPDHRLGLPEDQALYPHRCPTCHRWHDPEVEYSPPVAEKPVRTTKPLRPVRKLTITPDGLQDTADNSDLTPDQQELEDMMGDYD